MSRIRRLEDAGNRIFGIFGSAITSRPQAAEETSTDVTAQRRSFTDRE